MSRFAFGLIFPCLLLVACGTGSSVPATLTNTPVSVIAAVPATTQALPTVQASPTWTDTVVPPSATALPGPTVTPTQTETAQALSCEDLQNLNDQNGLPQRKSVPCAVEGTPVPTADSQLVSGIESTPTQVEVAAPPTPTRGPAPLPGPQALTFVVSNQIVTAMYRDGSGALYYGVTKDATGIGDPSLNDHAVWKLPVNGGPIQLTPFTYRLIGGIVVHNGTIYFNEGGQPGNGTPGVGNLRRMPDDNQEHQADIVLHYPALSKIWGHVNHALVKYTVNGQDGLLMAVGSIWDSSFDSPGHVAIQPPYYEPFPTGRILYANFAWLDATSNYQVTQGVTGQFDEYARGFRNPWAMGAGVVNGQIHVFAVDNDPAFTPEKYDKNPANAGDEVNDVYPLKNYGHPFAYAGAESAAGAVPPTAVFNDGSVPSGVAVAAGKLFVSLHDAGMIVKVDTVNHTWSPVFTNIQPFNLFGYGNLLYVDDFSGIRVIDARGL